MKIQGKLTISHLALCIAPLVLSGLILGFLFQKQLTRLNEVAQEKGLKVIEADVAKALRDAAEDRLAVVRKIRQSQVLDYLKSVQQEAESLAGSGNVVDTCNMFKSNREQEDLNNDQDMNVGDERYLTLWKFKGAYLVDYAAKHNYPDIYIIDADDGMVLFSVKRSSDLGKPLRSDRFKDSPLAKLWRQVKETGQPAFADFTLYGPNDNRPSAFIGAPIVSITQQTIGVLAILLPVDAFDQIMQDRTGLGETGESYLVGSDGLRRSDSVLDPEQYSVAAALAAPDQHRMTTESFTKAIDGQEGMLEGTDYRGRQVLSSYGSVEAYGTRWAVLCDITVEEALARLAKVRQGIETIGKDVAKVREDSGKAVIWTMVVQMAIFTVLVFVLTLFIARSLTKPIRWMAQTATRLSKGEVAGDVASHAQRLKDRKDEIGETGTAFNGLVGYLSQRAKDAQAIAQGDLTVDVKPASENDALGAAFVSMIRQLNEVMTQIDQSASQVANGAEQLSDSSQALSQGSTEQAASIEEIVSSMTEVGAQTQTNAENAAQADKVAIHGRGAMESGNEKMKQMIAAMQEVDTSSKQVAKIIKAIDDIAFQTNLLALNAAVEAARAGKHGKGFAVVAQEVRNLAGRSAKAAQETAELIESTVQMVEHGVETVNLTAQAFAEMLDGNTKVTDLIAEIAASSNEQSRGISQVNDGMEQVEKVTQQNASYAEETASAAAELSSQAAYLKKLLQRFRLQVESSQRPTASERKPLPATPAVASARPTSATGREKALNPESVISLDDDDFGRF